MLELGIFLTLMVLGYVFGRIAEHRHYRSIIAREKQTLDMPVMTMRTVPEQIGQCQSQLVSGSVVVSIDFFKKFVAGSAMRRVRRRQLLRNVCVALGNAGDPAAIPALERAAERGPELVTIHARWAIDVLSKNAT